MHYICLFMRAKSGREMTGCILFPPLMTITDKHICIISNKAFVWAMYTKGTGNDKQRKEVGN